MIFSETCPQRASRYSLFIGWGRTLLVLISLVSAFVPPYTAEAAQKNVLVLSSGGGRDSILRMESSLRAHFSGPVNFSIVDLENPRFEQKAYQDNLAEGLRIAYAGEEPDLVVAVMNDALHFAVQYHDTAFSGVPIVFMGITRPVPDKMWPGVTGVASSSGITETVDLALRLQPDTKAVATMTQGSLLDQEWLSGVRSELLHHQDKVKEIDIIGPATPELLPKIAALPAHTVVLFHLYPQDADQPAFGALDVLATVTRRFPTYATTPLLVVERGGIGGASYHGTTEPVLAGQLAARVLSGERPENIPVIHASGVDRFVNWQQLRRWNIPASALPPGTHVSGREPTLWEQGRKYFLAGIAVIAVQALLIFALFWQRARWQKAEVELGKSEEKFSKAFHQSPLAITIVSATDGRYVEVNEIFEANTGWMRDEVVGRTPLEIGLWTDPDQRTAFLRQLLETGNVRNIEVRFRRKDGQIRTSLGSAELIEIHGEKCALSVIADITERKQAEEAMASVSSRLIEAQEAERTRIARELHDDINQRLAMVAIILDSTRLHLPASEIETNRELEDATAQLGELGNDIQALSHRLHSSRLEYLGLEVAASGFCKEMSERQNVKIGLHYDDMPEGLSDQISLCLFRVLQEALHNAVKYSGVYKFDVSFTATSSEIELRVHDSGVGFDPRETSTNGHGLGLISMKERLKLVSGELSIDSKPGYGTTVLARVPLACDKGETGYSEVEPLDSTNQSVFG